MKWLENFILEILKSFKPYNSTILNLSFIRFPNICFKETKGAIYCCSTASIFYTACKRHRFWKFFIAHWHSSNNYHLWKFFQIVINSAGSGTRLPENPTRNNFGLPAVPETWLFWIELYPTRPANQLPAGTRSQDKSEIFEYF